MVSGNCWPRCPRAARWWWSTNYPPHRPPPERTGPAPRDEHRRSGPTAGTALHRTRLSRRSGRGCRAAPSSARVPRSIEATYLRADVRRPAEVKSFVDRIAQRYGGVDVAFDNAGIQEPWTALEQTSVTDCDSHAETSTRGVFLSIKYQIPHKAKGGVILVTGSANEFITRYGLSAYSSSKSAVTGTFRTAAIELGQYVSLAPAPPKPRWWRRNARRASPAAGKAEWGRVNVDGLRRMAKPEEMTSATLALASAGMSFLTVTSVVVGGGMLSGTGGGQVSDL
ncbi:SDR family NAD(P)-dependent oxidoreductase [Verrucosispora sp. TAA-831]|uniref:SDR family NAD(P)-dependent oxidoreductase n=1 Tax=Verrucosispora sp. TAA-831 TaxID=3422227 RepID=UPI003D6EBC98